MTNNPDMQPTVTEAGIQEINVDYLEQANAIAADAMLSIGAFVTGKQERGRAWIAIRDAALTSIEVRQRSQDTARSAEDLTPDMAKALPGGVLDDCTFSQIEDALDKIDAPMMDGERWLTLPERIAALTARSADVGPDYLANRKAVNGVLAGLLAPHISDMAELIEVGNQACTEILAALTTPPADDGGLRSALGKARDTLVAHHQWHAAQTDPDPEHGFIPADEYADSSLYERTVDTLAALDPFLRDGPRDTAAARQALSGGEVG